MVKDSILEKATSFISLIPEDVNVKKAYIFGSYAKGNEKEDSDIDIAVVISNMKDFFSTQMLLMRVRRNVDLRIEPHPIDEADFSGLNPFADEIQSTGIELTI